MKKVSTDRAPGAIGPYSQAIIANGFVFTSGQIPLSPETGDVVPGGIKEKTEQVIQNIKAVLEEAGSDITKVVKCTCFLKSMGDFAEFNEVYTKHFTGKPARSTIAASLPRDVLVEIDTVALCD